MCLYVYTIAAVPSPASKGWDVWASSKVRLCCLAKLAQWVLGSPEAQIRSCTQMRTGDIGERISEDGITAMKIRVPKILFIMSIAGVH